MMNNDERPKSESASSGRALPDDPEPNGPATDSSSTEKAPSIEGASQTEPSEEVIPQDEVVTQYNGKLWVTLLCIPFIIIAADACLLQGFGFFGPAVFLVIAAVVFGFGVPGRASVLSTIVTATLLILTAWRLAWCGNVLAMLIGYWLLFAYCFSLRGQPPFVLRVFGFLFECMPGSLAVIRRVEQAFRSKVLPEQTAAIRGRSIEYVLPAIAVVIFSGVFVMANADIVEVVSLKLGRVLASLNHFFVDLSVSQIFFWLLVGVLTGGILQPVIVRMKFGKAAEATDQSSNSPLYLAFRNTLISVIAIFGAYLLFELRAFTSGKPPEGFTYSSYAHEGAAWLTVALGLSTITLSLIFRGDLVSDHRYGKLERLAWGWSVLNFLLAVAVINRMWIYVGYNGMTQMRVVGLLGISAVLLGFVLVLVKIHCRHNFRWLLRRQSWVAGLMLWIFSVLPVDVWIHRYNVQAILNGNPAPIVQITEHSFGDECLNEFVPLCDSEDPLVAGGISQMLATRADRLGNEILRLEIAAGENDSSTESEATQSPSRRSRLTRNDASKSWTSHQWYRGSVLTRLDDSKAEWRREQRDSEVVSPWQELTTRAFELYW